MPMTTNGQGFLPVSLGRSLHALPLMAVLLGACGSAQQERARVAEIQREADRRVQVIRVEAEKRAAEAQDQIAKLKADLAAKNEELERGVRGRPEADAGADDAIAKDRRSLEERVRTALQRLDEESREIGRRSSALAKTARSEVDRALDSARDSRESIEDDLNELDRTTRTTLRPLEERLDRRLAELEETLKEARKKLK
jgi:hypothetical protein